MIAEAARGSLCFCETGKHIPFPIRRIFYIFGVSGQIVRGNHANIKTQQVLICLRGSVTIDADDGENQETVILSKPNQGLFLGKMVWRSMRNFEPDTILLVLASGSYEKKDYIDNPDIFKKSLKKNDHI